MAKGPRYCVPFRRRREGKTDYKARKALLLSSKPRLVTRTSLRNTSVQVIAAKPYGDEVIASAHSSKLVKNCGWKATTGNIPTAYLTGLLCGLEAREKGIKAAILDVGLHSPTKNGRIFAALKGVLDAGVDISHSETRLPDEHSIEGKHIAEYAEILTTHGEEYQIRFSKYLERILPPEKLPTHFAETKKKIILLYGGGKKS